MEEQEKKCPACGGVLELIRRNHPLSGTGTGGGLLSLFEDPVYTDVYRCEQCRRIELYETESGFFSWSKGSDEEEEITITCPECGNTHVAGIGCPFCAMTQVYSPKRVRVETGEEKEKSPPKEKKPAWEKKRAPWRKKKDPWD